MTSPRITHPQLPGVTGLGLLLLSSVSCCPAQTNSPPEEQNWRAVCKVALVEPLPTAAAQLAEAARHDQDAPSHCDEQTAYYGFGHAPNYAQARRCAYLQRSKQWNTPGDWVEGPGTLTMLYANGYGVPRDYHLAIRFACELDARGVAQAETQARIGRLEALRDGKFSQQKPLDLCDDAMSGVMGATASRLRRSLRKSAACAKLRPYVLACLSTRRLSCPSSKRRKPRSRRLAARVRIAAEAAAARPAFESSTKDDCGSSL